MSEYNVYRIATGRRVIDPNPVEMGLSPGEMRQSILDRARENIDKGHAKSVRSIINSNITDDDLLQAFEDYIYDSPNAMFKKRYFNFTIDPVMVEESW